MGTQLHKKRSIEPRSKSRRLKTASPPPDARRWLKVAETAAYLGVSLHHVYRMHRRGQLPSFKLPGLGVRVDRVALDAKIEKVKASRAAHANASWPI
jgi:excisionase family DNA binding protein